MKIVKVVKDGGGDKYYNFGVGNILTAEVLVNDDLFVVFSGVDHPKHQMQQLRGDAVKHVVKLLESNRIDKEVPVSQGVSLEKNALNTKVK